MHKERRRNVSHAQNVGLSWREITEDADVEIAIGLIKQTYKRKRVPLSDLELFKQAKTQLGEYVHWFAAYIDDKMIASQLRLCYNELVYAWYAASDEAYFKQRPNDFLTWNVLCWAHNNGYCTYDFGGGKPYGVRDYKLKYGCEMYDYGRYLYLHKPFIYKLGEVGVKVLKLKK